MRVELASYTARVLEPRGAAFGCVSCSRKNNVVLVGRDDGIFLFGADGIGPCFTVDGHKKLVLVTSDNHLAVLAATTDAASEFTIYDTANKLIVCSCVLGIRATHLVEQWGSLLLFGSANREVVRFVEKLPEEKTEMLMKKHLYSIAASITAVSEKDGAPAQVAEIDRRHAEHLLVKGDYAGAVVLFKTYVGVCGVIDRHPPVARAKVGIVPNRVSRMLAPA